MSEGKLGRRKAPVQFAEQNSWEFAKLAQKVPGALSGNSVESSAQNARNR